MSKSTQAKSWTHGWVYSQRCAFPPSAKKSRRIAQQPLNLTSVADFLVRLRTVRSNHLPCAFLVDPRIRRQDCSCAMFTFDHNVVRILVPRNRRMIAVHAHLDVGNIPLARLVFCGVAGLLLQLRVALPGSPTGAHCVV